MKQHIHEDIARQETTAGPSNRSFGITFAIIALVFAVFPLLQGHAPRIWASATSGIFLALAIFVPQLLAYPNLLWLRLGVAMNNIVSPIAMGCLFYGVITPIGLLMRSLGKDPLRLKLDKGASSYWIHRTPPGPRAPSLAQPY